MDRRIVHAVRRQSRPLLPTLAPDTHSPFPVHELAHCARRVLSALLSLAPSPHSRCPPSVPGARTGVSRTPRTVSSAVPRSQPLLPTLLSIPGAWTGASHTPRAVSSAIPRSRPLLPTPPSIPGAQTGGTRSPRTVCSPVPRSHPSLPTPSLRSQRTDWHIAHAACHLLSRPSLPTLTPDTALRSRHMDWRIAHAARRLLCRPSLPSLTPDARLLCLAHGPAYRARRAPAGRTRTHRVTAEAVVSCTTWLARAPGPPAHTGTHAGGTFRVTLM
ncbi:hypothetical protein K488DRAFT_90621 [Vararia minispora EC-137]|uniref:Uncharacterized protein n=1 Tax=Vararia minispora EC-137 TaxID=1314806 RepID=A0ACB8Q768_9AGAM|nr:hypothetical protein K488DRAFT_90621 [Vararia minispora EC-137]